MAPENTSNATPASNPPVAADAPELNAAQTPAPDLSGLAQPGAQPNLNTAVQNTVQPYVDRMNSASQKAAQLAQPPAPAKPVPHARLLAMVEGLSIGLSSAATAMATHGKEGGAEEVQEFYGKKQELQLQKEAAQRQQRDADLQHQLTLFNVAEAQMKTQLSLATLPTDLRKSELEVEGAQQNLEAGKQGLSIQLADFMKNNWGFTPQEVAGTTAGSVDPQHMANAKTQLGRYVGPDGAAVTVLGANDPAIKAVQDAIANPKATPKDIQAAGQGLQFAVQQRQEATEATRQRQSMLPKSLEEATALATDAEQKFKASPTAANKQALDAARAQREAAFNDRERQMRLDQNIREGDPTAAGGMLASYDTTISELKSRGMTPEYITKAIAAAKKVNPNYNAQLADNYANIARSEQNNQFFGNVNSLISSGGTIDQLAERSKGISQNDWNALNKAKNWIDAQTGQPAVAGVSATALGVVDDYAKVMGGGVGSDASRNLILQATNPNLSPAQRAAALQGIRDAVQSQKEARIGNNPFLRQMYGNTSEGSSQQASQNSPDPFAAVGGKRR